MSMGMGLRSCILENAENGTDQRKDGRKPEGKSEVLEGLEGV
jgi:hypothetical protein